MVRFPVGARPILCVSFYLFIYIILVYIYIYIYIYINQNNSGERGLGVSEFFGQRIQFFFWRGEGGCWGEGGGVIFFIRKMTKNQNLNFLWPWWGSGEERLERGGAK